MADNKVVETARLTGDGHPEGTLVEFKQDVFPHVKGDVKRVDKAELKRVNERAKANGLNGDVYVAVKADKKTEE